MITPLLQNYGSIECEILKNVETVYEQLKKDALCRLDKLYQNQVELPTEAIETAQRVKSEESEKVSEILEFLSETEETLKKWLEQIRIYE